jgi:hypothetical protein
MVCQWFGLKTTVTVFSGLASKSVATIFSGLALKPVVTIFSGLTSKSVTTFYCFASKPRWWRVFWFAPQNWQIPFGDLGLKITATVSWFMPQNQAVYGLSIAPQNRQEDATAWDTHRNLAVCFAWKQVRIGFSSLVSRLVET